MATLLQSSWTLDPGLSALRSAAVSPSGRLLVTYGSVGLSYVISVWDVGTREELWRTEPRKAPMMVRFTEDESLLIAGLMSPGDDAADVALWTAGSSGVVSIPFSERDVAGLIVSRSGNLVVLRHRSGGMTALDPRTGKRSRLGDSTSFDAVAVSPRGTVIVARAAAALEIYRDGSLQHSEQLSGIGSMDCTEEDVVVATPTGVRFLSGPHKDASIE